MGHCGCFQRGTRSLSRTNLTHRWQRRRPKSDCSAVRDPNCLHSGSERGSDPDTRSRGSFILQTVCDFSEDVPLGFMHANEVLEAQKWLVEQNLEDAVTTGGGDLLASLF